MGPELRRRDIQGTRNGDTEVTTRRSRNRRTIWGQPEHRTDKHIDEKHEAKDPEDNDGQPRYGVTTNQTDRTGGSHKDDSNDKRADTKGWEGPDKTAELPVREGGHGKRWEEDWWKKPRCYYAIEETAKTDTETNPWTRAGETSDKRTAERTTQELGSAEPPTHTAGIADRHASDAVAQAGRHAGRVPTPDNQQMNAGREETYKDVCRTESAAKEGGADPQGPHQVSAQDEARRQNGGRLQEDEPAEKRTAETGKKNARQGIVAVAPPANHHTVARQQPANARHKRNRRTRAQGTTTGVQRCLRRGERAPVHPHPHRRIGEASNPGPQNKSTAQTHPDAEYDPNPRRCVRCGNRWQRNASRALPATNTPCMACGARGPHYAAREQNLRPTLLHFQCTTCAWSSCPRCAGVPEGTTEQQMPRPNETGTPMTDQAKRRRSTTPDARGEINTPGPSTKLRRHGQSQRRRSDDESYSSDSSASEIQLPDSVRRILDFEQWAASNSTSSSEEYSDETPRSIPLLPYRELDIPTLTGADFTDFSAEILSPASSSRPTPTQPTQAPAPSDGPATPLRTPSHLGWAEITDEHELTDGYITETDRDVPCVAGSAQQLRPHITHDEYDPSEWTPPPKRHRATPSTARTAQATILDETDESDREIAGTSGQPFRTAARDVAAPATDHATPQCPDATAAREASTETSEAYTATKQAQHVNGENACHTGGDAAEGQGSPATGQDSRQRPALSSERGTATATPPEERCTEAPKPDTEADGQSGHNHYSTTAGEEQSETRIPPVGTPYQQTQECCRGPSSRQPAGPGANTTLTTRAGHVLPQVTLPASQTPTSNAEATGRTGRAETAESRRGGTTAAATPTTAKKSGEHQNRTPTRTHGPG